VIAFEWQVAVLPTKDIDFQPFGFSVVRTAHSVPGVGWIEHDALVVLLDHLFEHHDARVGFPGSTNAQNGEGLGYRVSRQREIVGDAKFAHSARIPTTLIHWPFLVV
jgi:hypothetical protein